MIGFGEFYNLRVDRLGLLGALAAQVGDLLAGPEGGHVQMRRVLPRCRSELGGPLPGLSAKLADDAQLKRLVLLQSLTRQARVDQHLLPSEQRGRPGQRDDVGRTLDVNLDVSERL